MTPKFFPALLTLALLAKGYEAYFDNKDYTKAREIWEPLAEAGNAEAQFNLGVLYENGRGVARDYSKARKWWEKAAAAGDVKAQNNLGSLYENGLGVEQDYAKAREFYEKAATAGDAKAQYGLGLLWPPGFGRGPALVGEGRRPGQ